MPLRDVTLSLIPLFADVLVSSQTVSAHSRVSKHLFEILEEVQDYATQCLWFYNHEQPYKANSDNPPLDNPPLKVA